MNFDVKSYGARGDGQRLDQVAIQRAIDECAATGGGMVRVPAGTYRTGALTLKSNVCLHLEAGSIIKAEYDPSLFPLGSQGSSGHYENYDTRALISAQGAENVSIIGLGCIDGGGHGRLDKNTLRHLFRPKMVLFADCRNVKVQDIRLQYPTSWTLHLKHCQDVQVRGIQILADRLRINTDGIDPDGCRNVTISDCNIQTGDDAIVFKSLHGKPCENITVTNCLLSSHCAALKLGTESHGDIRRLSISNCVIHNSNCAVAFYNKDGGVFEDITLANLVVDAPADLPFFLDITPRYRNRSRMGMIRNVTFANMVVTSPGRFFVDGGSGCRLQNLMLRDITWNITGECRTQGLEKPLGCIQEHADGHAPGINPLAQPYQFILSRVKDVDVRNVKLYDRTANNVGRRAFLYAHKGRNIRVRDSRSLDGPAGMEAIMMDECQEEDSLAAAH